MYLAFQFAISVYHFRLRLSSHRLSATFSFASSDLAVLGWLQRAPFVTAQLSEVTKPGKRPQKIPPPCELRLGGSKFHMRVTLRNFLDILSWTGKSFCRSFSWEGKFPGEMWIIRVVSKAVIILIMIIVMGTITIVMGIMGKNHSKGMHSLGRQCRGPRAGWGCQGDCWVSTSSVC